MIQQKTIWFVDNLDRTNDPELKAAIEELMESGEWGSDAIHRINLAFLDDDVPFAAYCRSHGIPDDAEVYVSYSW